MKKSQRHQGSRRNRSWPFLLICLLSAPLFSSCYSLGREFRLGDFDQIVITRSTMSEVRELLGNPLREIDVTKQNEKLMHFGDEKTTTIWFYAFASKVVFGFDVKAAEISFDGAGRVSDYDFSSTFDKDKVPGAKGDGNEFDIFLAKQKIVRGKTNKAQVEALLGKSLREIMINKPRPVLRWIYGYKKTVHYDGNSSGHTLYGNKDIFRKHLFVDFDQKGVVIDLRGKSDFPEDKDRFFTK